MQKHLINPCKNLRGGTWKNVVFHSWQNLKSNAPVSALCIFSQNGPTADRYHEELKMNTNPIPQIMKINVKSMLEKNMNETCKHVKQYLEQKLKTWQNLKNVIPETICKLMNSGCERLVGAQQGNQLERRGLLTKPRGGSGPNIFIDPHRACLHVKCVRGKSQRF